MSIKKIISGGQTGADRAALDFAIEYCIEHGGWVPEGRKAEDGVIPSQYNMVELPGGDYADRTARNIMESDGTLIISNGALTGGSLLTRVLAEKHQKPFLHIDMCKLIAFDAAIDVHEWIDANTIEVLNVAGPRESKDPEIYRIARNVLETVFHIEIIASTMPGMKQTPPFENLPGFGADSGINTPRTVDQAVDHLMTRVSPREKIRIASAKEEDLWNFADTLDKQFGFETGNQALMDDCRRIAGAYDDTRASMVILREFWDRLRKSGHLRVVR
jgi:hypothetical protein